MKKRLNICIPSYNRGKLALKQISSLLKRIEDKEYIEIVISNNGSDNETLEYEEIKKINSPQLIYFEFGSNQGFECNLRNAISLANSDLCMILSDEDDVIIGHIDYYIEFFESHSNLAVMYSKVENHPTFSTENVVYWEAGYEAEHSFYGDAYISGIIINKRIFGDEKINKLYDQYGKYYTYKFVPHLFWLGEAVLLGDFAYNPNVDLIIVGQNVSSRDLDCQDLGKLSVSRVMLPESYIDNSHEIIEYIIQRSTTYDVKILMIQQYLRYAYLSIHWLDLAEKANFECTLDRVRTLTDIYLAIDKNIENYVSDVFERRILKDIAGYEYAYAKEIYNRDAYIDSLIYMPETVEIETYLIDHSIRCIGIYGVGKSAEVPAVLIYRRIKSIASVILIDRDKGRFEIDASNPGRMQKTDPDFYQTILFSPDMLPENLDLVLVACAGYISEIRDYLRDKTSAMVVSVVELNKLIHENIK